MWKIFAPKCFRCKKPSNLKFMAEYLIGPIQFKNVQVCEGCLWLSEYVSDRNKQNEAEATEDQERAEWLRIRTRGERAVDAAWERDGGISVWVSSGLPKGQYIIPAGKTNLS